MTRSVAVLVGGSGLGQGLLILATPVLTRLYGPQDFGVFGVYASLLGVGLVVVSLRYEVAIPLPDEEGASAHLVVVALIVALGLSTAVGLGVWLLGDQIAGWLEVPALAPWLWILPLALASAGAHQALLYWSLRSRAFGSVAKSRLAQGATHAGTAVGLGLAGFVPSGLLLGDLVGRATAGASITALAWPGLRSALDRVRRRDLLKLAVRYRRFPLIASGAALVNQLGLQLPTLFAATIYGSEVAGSYELTRRVIGVPLALVGGAVSQVYLSEASRLASRPGAMRQLFTRTGRQLLMVGGIPILLLGLASPWLFGLVLGEGWSTAGRFAQLLALSFAVQFTAVPLSQTLNILSRQDLQLYWDVGRLTVVCLCFALAVWLDLPPAVAIAGYGLAMFLCYVALFGLSLTTLRRLERQVGRDDGSDHGLAGEDDMLKDGVSTGEDGARIDGR